MDNKIEKIISQNLIELRKCKGLKQTDLSDAIGYSDKTISRWENGTSIPDVSTLVELADFYEISIEDLIKENAVLKCSQEEKAKVQQKAINNYTMIALSTLTIWLLATMIYAGIVMFQEIYYYQVFIYAVPLSALFVYIRTRKKANLKWINFLLLSILVIGAVASGYVAFIQYNFWILFLIIAPLEAMCAVSVFATKYSSKKKNKKK